jgi:hypothetical protein
LLLDALPIGSSTILSVVELRIFKSRFYVKIKRVLEHLQVRNFILKQVVTRFEGSAVYKEEILTEESTASRPGRRLTQNVFRKSNTITVNESIPTYAAWPVCGGQFALYLTPSAWLKTVTFNTLAVQAPQKKVVR